MSISNSLTIPSPLQPPGNHKFVLYVCESVSVLILYLYEMMGVHWTYCCDHVIMYVSQIITLYTLNLFTAVCQLYLNKTGRKKREIKH